MSKDNRSIIGIAEVLTIVFVVLKLIDVIAWSWWWVLSPLWIPFAIILPIIIISFIILIAFEISDKSKKNRKGYKKYYG